MKTLTANKTVRTNQKWLSAGAQSIVSFACSTNNWITQC